MEADHQKYIFKSVNDLWDVIDLSLPQDQDIMVCQLQYRVEG